jgi:hypothetical protein
VSDCASFDANKRESGIITERDRAKAEFEENAITVLHGASPFFSEQ